MWPTPTFQKVGVDRVSILVFQHSPNFNLKMHTATRLWQLSRYLAKKEAWIRGIPWRSLRGLSKTNAEGGGVILPNAVSTSLSPALISQYGNEKTFACYWQVLTVAAKTYRAGFSLSAAHLRITLHSASLLGMLRSTNVVCTTNGHFSEKPTEENIVSLLFEHTW